MMTGFCERIAGKTEIAFIIIPLKTGDLVNFSTLFYVEAFPAKVILPSRGGANQTQVCLLSFPALNVKDVTDFPFVVQNRNSERKLEVSGTPYNKT